MGGMGELVGEWGLWGKEGDVINITKCKINC